MIALSWPQGYNCDPARRRRRAATHQGRAFPPQNGRPCAWVGLRFPFGLLPSGIQQAWGCSLHPPHGQLGGVRSHSRLRSRSCQAHSRTLPSHPLLLHRPHTPACRPPCRHHSHSHCHTWLTQPLEGRLGGCCWICGLRASGSEALINCSTPGNPNPSQLAACADGPAWTPLRMERV
jgi:hypothetical protein